MKQIFYLNLAIFLLFSSGFSCKNSDFVQNQGKKQEKALKITFLGIGQGDATLIKFPNQEQMLVDCAIDARVIEALGRNMKFHDKVIDYLLITHPDSDHYGGCVDVINRFEIGHIIYNGFEKPYNSFWLSFMESIESERKKGAKYSIIDKQEKWNISGVEIDFLYPDHDLAEDPLVPGEKKTNSNNTSITLMISYGRNDLLITGDAEFELENYLVEKYQDQLDVEILKIGHHGSDTSSIKKFLEFTTPEISVISSGKENQYGHPSRRVLKRLQRFGSEIWRTDAQGDIIVEIYKNEIHVSNKKDF